jgi:hypothetical protein
MGYCNVHTRKKETLPNSPKQKLLGNSVVGNSVFWSSFEFHSALSYELEEL